MQQPRLAGLDGRARENEVTAIRLAGPVVRPGPLAQGCGKRRGGFGVGWIYKCVNNFAVVEGGGPPRQ